MRADSLYPTPSLSDSAAQARRVLGGRNFESVVMYVLNAFVTDSGIFVVPGNRKGLALFVEDAANIEQIVSYTRLPVKQRCTQTQLEDYPDSDLFALVKPHFRGNPWRLLAIINCKVNFHSRQTEAAFWGLSVRSSSYIKYVCVTEDRDMYSRERPRSELGTSCEQSTKARRLLECYTDRVYISKRYSGVGDPGLGRDVEQMLRYLDSDNRRVHSVPIFDDPQEPRHTAYCHLVRPLDDLLIDLIRWKGEIPSPE
jgi:hypothetical protein